MKKIVIGLIAAGVLAAAFFLFRGGENTDAEGNPAAASARTGAAPSAPGQGAAAAAVVKPKPPPLREPGAPPPDAPRVMPYRPAKYLLYSEDDVSREAGAADDNQPVLQRIFEITEADPAQQVKIREFWKTHEDGRRKLYAEAYPRRSGPRILPTEPLEQLDLDFESAMFGILTPGQQKALSMELPPQGTPHTPPPKMWGDPINQTNPVEQVK